MRLTASVVVLAVAGVCLAWVTASPRHEKHGISGHVCDADGPLAGAVVRVRGTHKATRTGADGSFRLTAVDGTRRRTVTAWVEGYLIGWVEAAPGSDDVRIELEPLYTTDNTEYDWFSLEGARGSRTCGHCMPGLHKQWKADAHSSSAVNPRFLSVYRGTDVEGNQSPPRRFADDSDYGPVPLPPADTEPYFGPGYRLDFPDTPGTCAACHVPAAAAGPRGPYGADATDLIGIETEGIFCEFCHKVGGVDLDDSTRLPQTNMPGVLSMRLHRPHEGQDVFFGTLDDVTRRVTKLPLQQESAFCAPCHHASFWDTVVYDSYGEWLRSPYADPSAGQTCQQCHMPPTRARRIAIPEVGGVKRRPGVVSSHRMPGAADGDFLRRAVRLELDAERRADRVRVEVRVTNEKAGHHIPTGHPARNMILVVSARDRGGRQLDHVGARVVPEWGGVGDEPDDYAGQPGKGYAKVLEEAWTRVWPTVAYWNPTLVREDTRIPAMATDVTRYEFLAPGGRFPVTVRARLIYRRAFKRLAEQKKWDADDILMTQDDVVVSRRP